MRTRHPAHILLRLLLLAVVLPLKGVRGELDDDYGDGDGTPDECDLEKFEEWKFGARNQWPNLVQAERNCRQELNNLRLNFAGWWGPVAEEDIYDVMCSPACLSNDELHMDAMLYTGCNCEELSARTSNLESDFCAANSARMLCHQYKPVMAGVTGRNTELEDRLDSTRQTSKGSLSRCGNWQCQMKDYMCPRYEWNRKWICNGASTATTSRIAVLTLLSVAMGLAYAAW